MTRAFVKGVAAAGVAAGVVLATAGSALPAGKPKGTPTPAKPKAVKPVIFINQGRMLAQGLSVRDALRRDAAFVHYRVTAPHYLPKDFSLVAVAVYPYIPDGSPLSDTLTYYKAHSSAIKEFEVDHQSGVPYVYNYASLTAAKAGPYTVTVAEQKGRNATTHKVVDLMWIYWYNGRTKVATEVTAELQSSGLSRAELLKIAGSVS